MQMLQNRQFAYDSNFDKRGPPEGYLGDSQNSSSYKTNFMGKEY